MLSARPASRPPTKRQANASKDYDFLDEEPPLAIPAWSLSGAGSSSKVLSTLGAPVTLNGTNGAATARMESPLGKRSPNERRQSTGHGLLATLRKPSLAFSSPSNRSASPDKPTSPHAGSERGRMRSPSKTKPPPLQPVSLGRKHSASDDELDVDDEEPSIFGSPDTVKIDMPKVKTTPTSAPAHLKSFPTSPIEEMPKADMRADPLRSSSRLSPILDQRDRALSVSSVPRGSPIPSAFDGSLINSPSFVNGSGDPSMAGPQAVDGQIEEIVPWLFQGQQVRSLSFSRREGPKRSHRTLRPSSSRRGRDKPPSTLRNRKIRTCATPNPHRHYEHHRVRLSCRRPIARRRKARACSACCDVKPAAGKVRSLPSLASRT